MIENSSIEQELKQGRPVLVHTKGTSMQPLLRQGKTQVLICPAGQPLHLGDLPLVRLRPGLYRLHRLIRMEGGLLYTLGDNSLTIEEVRPEDVLGVVTGIYKGKQQIDMTGWRYRLYTKLWMGLAPVRLPVQKLYLRARHLAKKILCR